MLLSIGVAWAGANEILRLRDPVGCGQLVVSPELRAELVGLASPETQPSWVPIRAVTCLVELFPDAETVAIVLPWMADPATAGLALVVAGQIDLLPADGALQIATAGMRSPDARQRARMARRLKASTNAEVLAAVDAAGGGK